MTRFTSLVAKSLITLLIGSGTFAANLHAQSDAMIVSVPFPFIMGTQFVPPGTYRFTLVSSSFLLSVRDVKTGHEQLFPVRPVQQRALEQHGRLLFHNSEGCSVLNEVHFPGTVIFSEMIQRRAAGRIEAKGSSADSSMSVAQR